MAIARRSGVMPSGAAGKAPAPPRGSIEGAVWMVRVGGALLGRCSVRAARMSQQQSWRKKIVTPRCPLGGDPTATGEAPGDRGTLGVVLRWGGTRGTAPGRRGALGPAPRPPGTLDEVPRLPVATVEAPGRPGMRAGGRRPAWRRGDRGRLARPSGCGGRSAWRHDGAR